MMKNDGTSRWNGFSENKTNDDFKVKETVDSTVSVASSEEGVDDQQFEIVDDYYFDQTSQHVLQDNIDEQTTTDAIVEDLVSVDSQEDNDDQKVSLVIHTYSNSDNYEQLHDAAPEVHLPVVEKKTEVKIVTNTLDERVEFAEHTTDLDKEEVNPSNIKPNDEPYKKELVMNNDETAIRLIQDLNIKLDKIESTYISRNFVEKQQEEMINSLHRELIEYKEDAHKEHLKPFVKGVITIINAQYKRIREFTNQSEEKNPAIDLVIEELVVIIEDLENLLYPYEIDRLPVNEGDFYNADMHKTLKRVLTLDKEQDRKIKSILGYGYQWGSRIIEKAAVITYIYEEKDQGGE